MLSDWKSHSQNNLLNFTEFRSIPVLDNSYGYNSHHTGLLMRKHTYRAGIRLRLHINNVSEAESISIPGVYFLKLSNR